VAVEVEVYQGEIGEREAEHAHRDLHVRGLPPSL
jgi:hypothetical protein